MRRFALLVAMVLGTTVSASGAHLDLDGGARRTAKAVRSATTSYSLDGEVWLGKLRGVGGGRDTLVYVPNKLDATRAIDVVVYMEGIGSFENGAMKTRHVASMARLEGNAVYVAPDSPSSTLGDRASKNEHWKAGCAARTCAGGHAAPGDFLVFLDEVRTKIATSLGADRRALDLRVSLIGFSRGGKGVQGALAQLSAANFHAGGMPVRLADVIFADGNYHWNALDGSWAILASRPEKPRLTILVGAGAFDASGGDGNRRRALEFWRSAAPAAPLPTAEKETTAPRLRLVPVRGGHHAIGDAAVDFLRFTAPVAEGQTA
ncbi:MAG: hypothetical protein ACKV2T_07830 [Kofleriaceae bacterium]